MERRRRTVVGLLGVAALLLAAAPSARADLSGVSCSASAGTPPSMPAEGQTEQTADVLLSCTGGTPTPAGQAAPKVNLTLFFNTNVTSRLTSLASEAFLELGGGNSASGVVNGNSISWVGIPLDPPGPNATRTFRFTNLRVNASGLGVGPGGTPGQAVSFMTLSASSSVPVSNPQQIVGFVVRGLTTQTRNPAGSKALAGPQTLMRCANATNTRVATLRFAEAFGDAFKRRNTATSPGTPTATAAQAQPGGQYHTQTDYYDPFRSGASGLADFGTRLKAVFKNVPAGVTLYVDTQSRTVSGSDVARLTGTETGAFAGRAADPKGPAGAAKLSLSNGAGTAVWEVLQSDALTLSTLDLGVYVSYMPNAPKLQTATVNDGYAPNLVPPAAAAASATFPIPRFVDTSAPANLFTFKNCPPGTTQPVMPTATGPSPAPDSDIARISSPIRSGSLRGFHGTASDPRGRLKEVDIALVRLDGGARAARRVCRTLRSDGRLRARHPVRGRCRTLTFLRARGTTRWSFRLRRRLPAGSYVVYSRAVDRGGARESSFSARDRNRRAFRVR